ncbi:MAG: pyrroloquinoline quinone precursor peptide PqqA [Acidobacteria bacterium]|nr:pyrroloquinoline quinone precursor peptide PqqA [Acidobacteriota bacterium]
MSGSGILSPLRPTFCAVSDAELIQYLERKKRRMKTWTRPDFKEVSLGCEINSYSPAEI